MKLLKKWFFINFIAFTFLFIVSVNYEANASTTSKLVIHYYRFDNNYSNMYMHIWEKLPGNKPGADKKMSIDLDEYGTVTTINISDLSGYSATTPPTSVGIIIKTGTGWDYKDVSMDRFLDLSKTNENGELHAYFVQGDPNIGYSPNDPNGPDRSNKITSAYFKSLNQIQFITTKAVDQTAVRLMKDNVEMTPSSISMSGTKGTISISTKLDFSSSYELIVNFDDGEKKYSITYDGIYDSTEFENAFYYEGELGAIYTPQSTTFKLWAPISTNVQVCLYTTGAPSTIQDGGDDTGECVNMTLGEKGVWSTTINGDQHGKYYTYKVTNDSATSEVVDPYATSGGVNGIRGMVLDFSKTNPANWTPEVKPDNMVNYTDAIIYELHVRDLTTHQTWNGNNAWRGKFLGLTQRGTSYQGVTTGLDHLIELGITHLHLLPSFDFGVVDETRLNDPIYAKKAGGIFNWGYMPLNFNMPEGSYSTDPYKGEVRVNEFKQMVQTLHDNDIRVVMDVVYNHTGLSSDSNFHLILPGYFHRMTQSGGFSNGSGTGNELASERVMARKFMVDSLIMWAREYNIDGFRFDLMALHDVETMITIKAELHSIDPTIIIYGEPWMGGSSVMSDAISADKDNVKNMPLIAAFNDDTRDGIKGAVMDAPNKGFVQGNLTSISKVKYGITGGINHPDLGNYNVWHTEPTNTINYVSAHDNHTLFDKLMASSSSKDYETISNMHKQANGIVLTSQGIPFLHAGVDFMRSKGGDHNSYESPDSVNQLDWSLKVKNIEVFNYYKGLITLRKAQPAFRMATSVEIIDNLEFMYKDLNGVIAYKLKDYASGDTWGDIIVMINGSKNLQQFNLPEGDWNLVVNQKEAGTETIDTLSNKYYIKGNEVLVMYQVEPIEPVEPRNPNDNGNNLGLIIGVSVAAITITAAGLIFYYKKTRA
jgi:pullulanase